MIGLNHRKLKFTAMTTLPAFRYHAIYIYVCTLYNNEYYSLK